jgi:hypothetical protein
MATEKQIQANKLNSQKSTGPKTPEGKAKSSLNRLSHGFASNARIIPGEDPEQFKGLLFDLVNEYQPATATEQILVEEMVTNRWLSLRAFRLQGEAFLDLKAPAGTFVLPKDLGLLIRYQTSAERAFHKAHNELVNTRKQRLNSEIGFEPQTFGEEVGEETRVPDPTPEAPPKQPENAPVAPISSTFSPEKYGLPATVEELDREFFEEAMEYFKKVS